MMRMRMRLPSLLIIRKDQLPDHDYDGDKNNEDDDDDENDEDYGGDEHKDVSHDNLVVVWALSAGHCLKFPSFSSFPADL